MPTATGKALATAIDQADEARLLSLVEAHAEAFDLGTVRRVIRHPFVTGDALARLLEVPSLRANYGVRSRIARHPKTPSALAQALVPDLYWRDLLEISVTVRLAPVLRRSAERLLLERWPRLAVGERIAVARRASAGVLTRMLKETDPRVVAASLSNPRMTEVTVLALAGTATASPQVLQRLAGSGRWRNRYAVRQALALNPQTPLQAQQALLRGLRFADLERVVRKQALSSVVRRWAQQALAERRRGPP